jgi:hypothetical protein
VTLLTLLQIWHPAPSVSNDDAWDVAPGMLSSSGVATLADLPFAAYYDLTVRRRIGVPVESLAGPDRRVVIPIESLAGMARRLGVPIESLVGLARKLGIPVESLSGSGRRAGAPVESLVGLARRLSMPVEAIVELMARRLGVPVESLAATSRLVTIPVEWSSTAQPSPGPGFPPQPGGGVALPKRRRPWPTMSEPVCLVGLVVAPPARLRGDGAAEPDELFGEEGRLLGLV